MSSLGECRPNKRSNHVSSRISKYEEDRFEAKLVTANLNIQISRLHSDILMDRLLRGHLVASTTV